MSERDVVDDLLHRSAAVDVPSDVEARMHGQLAAFRTRLASRRPPLGERLAALLGASSFRWAAAGAVVAVVIAIPFVGGGSEAGRVYAEGVSRLGGATSLQYTIELAPFVDVEVSYRAPMRERVRTSWGIEIRADGSGTELVLMHATRQYVRGHRRPGVLAHAGDVIAQLTSLPKRADAVLAERLVGGRRLLGYRVLGSRMPGAHGAESIELWIDAESGVPNRADITPSGAGGSGYQMHITRIRVNEAVDAALFEMTPPTGYVEATAAGAPRPDAMDGSSSEPAIVTTVAQPAVVLPMQGAYAQAAGGLARVEQELRARGIVPTGLPFGSFGSEARWQVGYPVSPGTTVQSPFEVVELPGGQVASLVVTGPWGEGAGARWSRLLAWTSERGYVVMGPPTEIWSGPETEPAAQVTEMRVAVVSAHR
jgi:effector-binding domain-containing protein